MQVVVIGMAAGLVATAGGGAALVGVGVVTVVVIVVGVLPSASAMYHSLHDIDHALQNPPLQPPLQLLPHCFLLLPPCSHHHHHHHPLFSHASLKHLALFLSKGYVVVTEDKNSAISEGKRFNCPPFLPTRFR